MKHLLPVFFIISLLCLSTGCAIITGGSSYYANIVLESHPDAEIEYQGRVVGKGRVLMKVKRRDANRLQFTVREEGCEPVPVSYLTRGFRTGPLIIDYFLFGIPGLLIDGLSGALWEPDSKQLGIQKLGPRNYLYLVSLPECHPHRKKAVLPEAGTGSFSIITLFNGKTISGMILENNPGNYLRVQLPDKSIQTIEYGQIIEISDGK